MRDLNKNRKNKKQSGREESRTVEKGEIFFNDYYNFLVSPLFFDYASKMIP